MCNFLSSNLGTFQAIAAIVTTVAVAPSAIWFLMNQEAQRKQRKEEKFRYCNEQFKSFLKLYIQYPELSLEDGEPKPVSLLDEKDLHRRDVFFDLLTNMFEAAYLAYDNVKESYRKEQWSGWEAYIARYCRREDYIEWWIRILCQGNIKNFNNKNITEADLNFDKYIKSVIRPHIMNAISRPDAAKPLQPDSPSR